MFLYTLYMYISYVYLSRGGRQLAGVRGRGGGRHASEVEDHEWHRGARGEVHVVEAHRGGGHHLPHGDADDLGASSRAVKGIERGVQII